MVLRASRIGDIMQFNPLALLGGMQGWFDKQTETSNKVNAMNEQNVALQDIIKQRKRAQAHEDKLWGSQEKGIQQADEIADILHGYNKESAPLLGRSQVQGAQYGLNDIGNKLALQPGQQKLALLQQNNDLELIPKRHLFEVGELNHGLNMQPSRHSVDSAMIANQGRELNNAWMRPHRAKFYEAQTAYDDAMAIANDNTQPHQARSQAYFAAIAARNRGIGAFKEAAVEATNQGVNGTDWHKYFLGDQTAPSINNTGPAFGGNKLPTRPVGSLTDMSVLGNFDMLSQAAHGLFDPTKDMSVTMPTVDPNNPLSVTEGNISFNHNQVKRYLANGFMPAFKALTQGYNMDLQTALQQYTNLGFKPVANVHYTDSVIPPTIKNDKNQQVVNPLYTAMVSKLQNGPATQAMLQSQSEAKTSFTNRLNTLASLVQSNTMSEQTAKQLAIVQTQLTMAGFNNFANSIQKTISGLGATITAAEKQLLESPTMLQSMIPSALKAFKEGKANSQQLAAVKAQAYKLLQDKLLLLNSYGGAALSTGKPQAEFLKWYTNGEFAKVFSAYPIAPAVPDSQQAPAPGGITPAPPMTGGGGGGQGGFSFGRTGQQPSP